MNRHDILQEKTFSVFCKYASTSVLSMLGLSLYVLADTFFVANGVGSAGLAGLNLVLPVYSVLNGIGLMLGIGGATRFSLLRGEGETEKGNRVFTQVLWAAIAAGVFFTLAGIFLSGPIATMLGADEEILPYAETYLRTLLCYSLAFLLDNLAVAFLRNDNAPHLAMRAKLAASATNIVLDYVFIFPFGLGMFGAALATGISPIVSLIIISSHFRKKKNGFHPVRCAFSFRSFFRAAQLGLPALITEFSSGVVMLVFNFVLLALAGNTGVAAYGILANIFLVAAALFNGISQGIQPIVSVNCGAGRNKEVRKVFVYGCILALLVASLLYGSCVLFPGAVVSLFNGENDAHLAQIAVQGLPVYFIAFFPMGLNLVSASLFASVSVPKQAFAISILRGLVLVIPLLLLLARFLGLQGVWSSVPLAEFCTLLVSGCFVSFYFYKQKAAKAK